MNFLQPNVPYIRIGYKSQAAKQTEFNAVLHREKRHHRHVTKLRLGLHYKKLQLSKGFLQCFDMFSIIDVSENGEWDAYVMNYNNSAIEYPGFIFILYNPEDDSWFTHVHDQPITSGTSVEVQGFPLKGEMNLLGWAFVYDKSLGQVSNKCLDFHSMHINEDED